MYVIYNVPLSISVEFVKSDKTFYPIEYVQNKTYWDNKTEVKNKLGIILY